MTLAEIAGMLDSKRRVIGKTLADLGQNPGDVLSQWGSQIKEDLGAQQGRDLRTFGMMGAGDFQGAAQNASSDYMPLAMLGMTAYHGSPHLFDKFDMSKIGTGEGAQAYGHGLYFAENPAVAKSYTTVGDTRKVGEFKIDGKPLPLDSQEAILARNALADNRGDKDAARAWLEEMRGMKYNTTSPEQITAAQNLIDRVDFNRPANLYKVDIPDEHVAKMLDWDKPLSEQPQAIQDALASIDNPMFKAWQGNGAWPHISGQTLYRELAGGLTNGSAASGQHAVASSTLRDAGIPGIRYLDGGSRGKGGTSNFVVFDDAIPKIVGRE